MKPGDDFGKILERWEQSKDTQGGHADSSAFERWIDSHPAEDKDAQRADHNRPDRRNPQKMKVDDTLDLHGYTLEEARRITAEFIEKSVVAGHQKVLIIHGKGENGQGVLRREIRVDLERNPLTGTMGYNRGSDGGRGALWVILRTGKRDRSEPSAPDR